MRKMKIRRRILSFLLAVCMMIPYFSVESYATESTGPSNEVAECYCKEKCSEDNFNEYCDACMADYNGCAGNDVATVYANESELVDEGTGAGEVSGEVLEAAAVSEPTEGEEGVVDNGVAPVEEAGSESHEHADLNRDGVCDDAECKDKVAYIVCVESQLLGGDVSVANITMDPADGYVKVGESVTVTAPDMLEYQFAGWYEIENDVIQEDAKEPSFSYTFEPESDVTLCAVYEAKQTAQVDIKIAGGNFTVTVGQETTEKIGTYSARHSIGTEITIIAEDEGFSSWQNEYNKIVTTRKDYTFTVTGAVTLSMSKMGTNSKAVVEFLSDSKQVIYRTECTKEGVGNIKFPAVPAKPGYVNGKWNKTSQGIYKAIQDGNTYVAVEPTYEKSNDSCQVQVSVVVDGVETSGGVTVTTGKNAAGIELADGVYSVPHGEWINVTVAAENAGKTFWYWADGAGNILGYNTSYSTIIKRNNANVVLKAVYGNEAVEAKPAIAVTSVYTMDENEKKYLAISVTRDIPEEYKLVEHGVIASTTLGEVEVAENDFVLGSDKVKKVTSASTLLSGVYTLTVNRTNKETDTVVARGYLIVEKDGNKEIYYTDMVKATYNQIYKEIYGCIHTYQYSDSKDGNNHTKWCTACGKKEEAVPELHNIVYSVNGTTIDVVCEQGCGYEGSVELSVTNNEEYLKCGADKTIVTVTKTGIWENDSEHVIVNYKAKNAKENVINNVAPTTAGTYIVSVAVVDDSGKEIATVSDEYTISHYDNGTDGRCDAEGCDAVVSYKVTAKAHLSGVGTEIVKLSMNPTNGEVAPGEIVTIVAPSVLNHQFLGWYSSKDIDSESNEVKEDAEPIETSLVYSYGPNLETCNKLVAVYEESVNYAEVTFNGTSFTVSAVYKEEELDVALSEGKVSLPIGATVTVVVDESETGFVNWTNQLGKVVTTEKKYTFTVTGGVTFEMTRLFENQTLVEYVSDYDQVIASKTYTYTYDEETETGTISPEVVDPTTVSGPYKKGYSFKGWNLSKEDIIRLIKNKETYIKVTPVYDWEPNNFGVTVYVNGVKNDELSEPAKSFPEGTIKTVKAPEVDGRKFQCWTDGDGTILGYNETYSIKVTKDIILKAVYVKEEVQVTKKPTIVMTDVYAVDNGGQKQLSFMATRDIPKGDYTLVEHGIIIGAPATPATGDTFVLGATGTKKVQSSSTEYSGVYTATISIPDAKVDSNVAARGYLIVKINGQEEIYYSDVVNRTYNNPKGTN